MIKDKSRIISAIVMILMMIGLISLGQEATFIILVIVGLVVSDEILINFLKLKREKSKYLLSQVGYLILILGSYFFQNKFLLKNNLVVQISILMNIGLLFYLFYNNGEQFKLTKFLPKNVFFVSIYIFFNIFSLSYLFFHQYWWQLLTVLLFVTYGMDTGAWFFGKNFGKHKLWPKVSPNKTVEGLIGGMITSGILGGICFHLIFRTFKIEQFFLFCLFGAVSQLGDLLQSKLKREAGIKDSSQLIPGHGGVFDRVDSLFFLTPFYLVLIQYYLA